MIKEFKPPFSKHALGTALWSWGSELKAAYGIAKKSGCALIRAKDQFVVARVIGDGVRLVLYPHRTTALNYHLRVRDEGSKNPCRALDMAMALDVGTGLNCTFSMKGEALLALKKRIGRRT